MLETINIRIKKILVERDITLTKLAEDIGTSKQNLSRMLDNEDFKVSTLLKISDALNLHPSYFLSVNKNDYMVTEPSSHYQTKTESELLFELRDQVRNLQKEIAQLKLTINQITKT